MVFPDRSISALEMAITEITRNTAHMLNELAAINEKLDSLMRMTIRLSQTRGEPKSRKW